MQQTLIQSPPLRSETGRDLVLFFAGWGMDETPFRHCCRRNGADLMICYDYRTLDFNADSLWSYRSVTLIAWSMGVWAAEQALRETHLPIRRSIALNGTPYPVDEERGIAPSIFQGTLQGLDDTTLQKFQRRMCGSAQAYKAFAEHLPQRPTDELREELTAILWQYQTLPPANRRWTKAVIGRADRIFLPINQQRAWTSERVDEVEHTEAAHYDADLLNQLLQAYG